MDRVAAVFVDFFEHCLPSQNYVWTDSSWISFCWCSLPYHPPYCHPYSIRWGYCVGTLSAGVQTCLASNYMKNSFKLINDCWSILTAIQSTGGSSCRSWGGGWNWPTNPSRKYSPSQASCSFPPALWSFHSGDQSVPLPLSSFADYSWHSLDCDGYIDISCNCMTHLHCMGICSLISTVIRCSIVLFYCHLQSSFWLSCC